MNGSRRPNIPFLIISIVFGLVTFQAQHPSQTPPNDEVIRVSSRLVVVPVSVTDPAGQPVLGLAARDFRIIEGNRQQNIESVGVAEAVPLEIALLFDVSASTDTMFRFQQETAAQFLRDVMRPMDRASIFSVGQLGVLIQPRDTALRSIVSIAAISPTKEQTAFYDSLRMASDYLRTNAPAGSRRVVVIISDGEDTNSVGVVKAIWNAERKIAENIQGEQLRGLRVRARDGAKIAEQSKVMRSLQDADVTFYSINPAGSSFQLNKISQFGQENMQKFADETGGTAFLPKFQPIDTKDTYQNDINLRRNQETLRLIFRQLANELRSQYLIQYYSESDHPVNSFVKLSVLLNDPTQRRIRARQGYFVKD